MSAQPVLHYFNLGRLGRGEVVRLFLAELQIDYKNEYYEFGEAWDKNKDKIGLSLTGTLPVLDMDGQRLTQHVPILRYLARKVGGYDGETNLDKFTVDAVTAAYEDWRGAWVTQLSNKTDKYTDDTVPRAHRVLDSFYKQTSGPYLLGDKVTYADFAVYMLLDNDDRAGSKITPPQSLLKLVEAMKNRPNLKAYLTD